jgi:thioredoxin reductase (NADPH)
MYDLIIIGAGPAGLSAAIYASRYKINFIVLSSTLGGYVSEAHLIENWLGEKSITGKELSKKFVDHVEELDVNFKKSDANKIEKINNGFRVFASDDTIIDTRSIILATGSERSKLNVKGEKEFLGKGVSYCATCDGFFFRKKNVAVIGGGDAALTAALYLADLAEKVYLIHRGDSFRANKAWQEKVKKTTNIEVIMNIDIKEIMGDKIVKKVLLSDKREIAVNGVFIEIGSTPINELIQNTGIETDEKGYIIVDGTQATNIKNVWAAGDITTASSKLKQIVTAASEGAVATYNCYLDLKKNK